MNASSALKIYDAILGYTSVSQKFSPAFATFTFAFEKKKKLHWWTAHFAFPFALWYSSNFYPFLWPLPHFIRAFSNLTLHYAKSAMGPHNLWTRRGFRVGSKKIFKFTRITIFEENENKRETFSRRRRSRILLENAGKIQHLTHAAYLQRVIFRVNYVFVEFFWRLLIIYYRKLR